MVIPPGYKDTNEGKRIRNLSIFVMLSASVVCSSALAQVAQPVCIAVGVAAAASWETTAARTGYIARACAAEAGDKKG